MAYISKIKVNNTDYDLKDSNAVTLNTNQTISGTKTFTSYIKLGGNSSLILDHNSNTLLSCDSAGIVGIGDSSETQIIEMNCYNLLSNGPSLNLGAMYGNTGINIKLLDLYRYEFEFYANGNTIGKFGQEDSSVESGNAVTYLEIGNPDMMDNEGNELRIWVAQSQTESSTGTYASIRANAPHGSSSGVVVYLPSESGTLALTSDIPSAYFINAYKTDGIFKITGTGGANSVSYSIAPYTSLQSGVLSFYTSSTNPTGTSRLNLNGYLYATKLYSGGTEVSVEGHTHSYLSLTGGTLSGDLIFNNGYGIKAKDTSSNVINVIRSDSSNNVYMGGSGWSGIYVYNYLHPISDNVYYLGNSTHKWKEVHGVTFYENGTSLASKYLTLTGGDLTGQLTIKNLGQAKLVLNSVVATVDYFHLYVTDVNGGTHRPIILQNGYGNVGIGLIAPSYKLDVNGTMNATTIYENGTAIDTIIDNKIASAVTTAINAYY